MRIYIYDPLDEEYSKTGKHAFDLDASNLRLSSWVPSSGEARITFRIKDLKELNIELSPEEVIKLISELSKVWIEYVEEIKGA
jgi:hypothetical protein